MKLVEIEFCTFRQNPGFSIPIIPSSRWFSPTPHHHYSPKFPNSPCNSASSNFTHFARILVSPSPSKTFPSQKEIFPHPFHVSAQDFPPHSIIVGCWVFSHPMKQLCFASFSTSPILPWHCPAFFWKSLSHIIHSHQSFKLSPHVFIHTTFSNFLPHEPQQAHIS